MGMPFNIKVSSASICVVKKEGRIKIKKYVLTNPCATTLSESSFSHYLTICPRIDFWKGEV